MKVSNIVNLVFITLSISLKAQNVGIGTTIPGQKLEVNGKIRVGNDANSPAPGTLRWNATENDLEVYDGSVWKSLTKSSMSIWGNSVVQESRMLLASDGNSGDYFGTSVSISGNYIVVGSPNMDIGANSSQGAAYIFFFNGTNWVQQAKIIATDGDVNDYFGYSVDISGDYCVIGAPYNKTGGISKGAAYIFYRTGTTWNQQAKLIANDGASNDEFGTSVSIDGDYCVIGASSDDVGSNQNQGSAYFFKRNSGIIWTQISKATASDGAVGDYFGYSVSINGDNALIGSPLDAVNNVSLQGSAYLFTRSGTNWTQFSKYVAPDGSASDYFGYSVCIKNNTFVIGAPFEYVNVYYQGAAYIWRHNGVFWSYHSKIFAPDAGVEDYFGTSVSINNDHILIGSNGYGNSKGIGYLFTYTNNTYALLAKLASSNGSDQDQFGISCCISENHCVVGSKGFDYLGDNQGSAYIFSKN